MSAKFTDKTKQPTAHRVGNCLVHFSTNRVFKHGEEIKVEPKAMDVLYFLLQAAGETVTKDELIQRVWGETLVTENSLTQAISKLRKILEDDGSDRQAIDTISKKGYRLVASVGPVYSTKGYGHSHVPQIQEQRHWRVRFMYVTAILVGTIFVGLYFTQVLLNDISASKVPSRLWPLTSTPGVEMHPSFFGNDSFLVFSRYCSPVQSVLYIKELSNGHETKLVAGPGIKKYPRVLADSRRIAFVRETKKASAIFSIPLAGGQAEEILWATSEKIAGLDASPKGDWIAFPDQHVAMKSRALFRFDLGKNRLTQLTTPPMKHVGDKLPAISPDGNQIAFVREDVERNEDIYILEIKSGHERRITRHNLRIWGLDWSADGSAIVYCLSDPEDIVGLMKITLSDNSTNVLLSSIEAVGLNPAVSQRNDKVAFESWLYSTNIYRMSLGTPGISTHAEVLVQSTRSDLKPQYSPDGSKFAFISDRSGFPEIWVLENDDQNPRRLSDLALTYRSSPPRWSPDGSQIVIDTKSQGKNKIYAIGLETGTASELVAGGISPNFSRDGKWLYFSSHQSGSWEIWKTHTVGGKKIQVTSNGGYLASESIDGNRLYFSKLGQAGIWRQSSENPVEEIVCTDLEFADRFHWLVTREGIYYIHREANHRPFLYFFDFTTTESDRVATLAAGPYTRTLGLSLSPDRRHVLFSQANELDSDIMWIDYPR